jgi:hypothetical protein
MQYTRRQFELLPEDATEEQIRLAAEGLERHHYEPMTILRVPGFITWKKQDVLDEYDRLISLPANSPELRAVVGSSPQEVVEKQLGMILYHYELLCRLRLGDAEAWDVVHELYEDD